MKCLIIDGYIDEPSCFGVPPYISPYSRYIYGLLKQFNISPFYLTIDSIRKNNFVFDKNFDDIIIIGGLSVPGKYINTHLITLNELKKIISIFKLPDKILVGALNMGYTLEGGKIPVKLDNSNFKLITDSNFLTQIFKFFCDKYNYNIKFDKEKIIQDGTDVVFQHHYYPNLICEIETYSGCRRINKCSFCVEQFNNNFTCREPENIINEMFNLYKNKIRHFRIGNQPDIFGYHSSPTPEGYRPNPEYIKKLFYGINEKMPDLKTLHTDNANPEIISSFPFESKQILKCLVQSTTPGNVLALGCESFDLNVIKNNKLNATPEQSFKAIELINEIGNFTGKNGMPLLLPGINLLHKLLNETPETWKLNYEFLQKLIEKKLMVRRINIRQVIAFEHSYISKFKNKVNNKTKKSFLYYKELIRKDIDNKILKILFPFGHIIKDNFIETKNKYLTFARQLGTYPMLIGIPDVNLELKKFQDLVIVNHGFRSLTGLTLPININRISYDILKSFNNKNIANEIIFNRPYSSMEDMKNKINYNNHKKIYDLKNFITF